MVGPINSQAVGTSFLSCPPYLFPFLLYLLVFLLCFFVLFQSYCSHAQVFGRTLTPEFRISYRHTEWYLHFSQGKILITFAIVLLVKNKTIIIIVVYLNPHRRENTISMQKLKKIFLKYPDSMYILRKATQGCVFSLSNVICTFFIYLINII